MRRRRRIFFSFGVLGCIALAASCREPTQITLRITTGEKCSDLTGVQIVVGSNGDVTQTRFAQHFAAAVTHACAPDGGTNVLGTVVVTPGTSTGTVVIAAGVNAPGAPGPDPADCADLANAKRCIVARRSFSFIDHTSLNLPIDLDPLCVGKTCDPASTCFKGACVNDNVACQGSECLLPQQTGSGSGADASSPDGAYDAESADADDAMSASDSGNPGDASDSGADALAVTSTFDAGSPGQCNIAQGTCSPGGGHVLNPMHLPSSSSRHCCRLLLLHLSQPHDGGELRAAHDDWAQL